MEGTAKTRLLKIGGDCEVDSLNSGTVLAIWGSGVGVGGAGRAMMGYARALDYLSCIAQTSKQGHHPQQ